MKKIIVCSIIVLQYFHSFGQEIDTLSIDWNDTTKSQTIDEFLEIYFEEVDFGKMQSNVFYGGVVPYSNIQKFEGKNTDSVMYEHNFWQLYHELRMATKHSAFLPDIDSLRSLLYEYYTTYNKMPLIILDVEYDVFKSNATQSGSLVHLPQKPGLKTTTTGNPFEKNKCFAVMPYFVSELPLVIDPMFIFSNYAYQWSNRPVELKQGKIKKTINQEVALTDFNLNEPIEISFGNKKSKFLLDDFNSKELDDDCVENHYDELINLAVKYS